MGVFVSTADLIAELRSKTGVNPWSYDHDDLVTRAADALEDAVAATSKDSQRVVSTVAELDALPVGAVVRAADGDVCEKMPVKFSDQTTDIRWRSPAWDGVLSEADIAIPATVLWVGGTE